MADLTEEEWFKFEDWLTKQVKDKTDADAEVVAEYIVALFKSNANLDDAYRRCLVDVPEFFTDGVDATKAIDTIFQTLKQRSFLSPRKTEHKRASGAGDRAQAIPSWDAQRTGQNAWEGPLAQFPYQAGRSFNPRATSFAPSGIQYGRGGVVGRSSRKRGRQDDVDTPVGNGNEPRYADGERQIKQMRRGGRERGRAGGLKSQGGSLMSGRDRQEATTASGHGTSPPNIRTNGLDQLQLPGLAGQFSLEDMQRILASFAAMSAAMGMPTPPGFPTPATNGDSSQQDYHGSFNSAEAASHSNGRVSSNGSKHSRGRTRRGGHADFSSNRPPPDRSITSIVVEHIPQDHFDESAIRTFFSEFGEVVDIDMREHRFLAIVKFSDNASAFKAWKSPKSVFDNRFVKVYWYKPEAATTDDTAMANGHGQDEAMLDPEALAKLKELRQKQHEERQLKREELQAQRLEITSKLKKHNEEKRQLIDKLAERQPNGLAEGEDGLGEQMTWEKKKATEALKERLAAIEAQAESLGLKGDEHEDFTRGFSPFQGRGRGSYRARGSFNARARAFDGYRGAHYGGHQGGVLRLDNRPKSLTVSLSKDDEGLDWSSEHDEALRSFLFTGYDFDSIEPHPERKDSQVVSFKERYMADMFIAAAQHIPGIGKVWLAWAPKTAASERATVADTGQILEVPEEGEVDEEEQRQHHSLPAHDQAMGEDEEDFDIA